jgi:magnesium transporter
MIRFFAFQNGTIEKVKDAPATMKAAILWIDILDPTREEELSVEALLGLQIPTREEMRAIEESARLYREGDAVFMTAVIIDGVSEGRPSRAQATFVLSPEHLVTVRYADPMPFRTFEAKMARQPELHSDASAIFASLLENIVERIADVLELVAAELNQVSTAIFLQGTKSGRNRSGRTSNLREQLIQLGRKNLTHAICRESLHSLSRLLAFAGQGSACVKDSTAARLRAVDADVRSLAAYEGQLSGEITFLQESTLGLINIEQNSIIKVFSIAAVLFLPPTLVGTVYGMNFRFMPELDWMFGYPMALGLMVASALVPYFWFKRQGWF